MSITLEDLVGQYVSRTERRGSPYFSTVVRGIAETLRDYGYRDGNDTKDLRMKIRKLLAKEQELTAEAAAAKAAQFASKSFEADDMVQEAWLEALEKTVLQRPEGHTKSWLTKLKIMRSPVTVSRQVARDLFHVGPEAE